MFIGGSGKTSVSEVYKTKIDDFIIRAAKESDSGLILGFIHKLAEYEKLAHEVVATEGQLREHLFGEHPVAEVLIGEFEGRPVGFALFFNNFSTFLGRPGTYLEDLFVDPDERGRGFGKALLTCLANLAVARNCGRLEWCVRDWNKPAIDFYHSLGAKSMNGWTINRVVGKALQAMADDFETLDS